MNAYSYRPLSDDDLAVICAFPQNAEELFYMGPSYSFPLTPEQIKSRLPDRYCPTVILDRDRMPVAYANLYDPNTEESSCWLGNVIVSPEHRGTGTAAFLIEMMMTRAREELGCERMKLYCHNTNTRALLFYTKIGFIPIGSKPRLNHKQQPIVAIEMEKHLAYGLAVPDFYRLESAEAGSDNRMEDEFDGLREGMIWDDEP